MYLPTKTPVDLDTFCNFKKFRSYMNSNVVKVRGKVIIWMSGYCLDFAL